MARFRRFLAALIAGAALVSCTNEENAGADAPAGGAAAIDACALLTTEEINAAMGGALGPGAPGTDQSNDEVRIASCSWGTDAEPAMFVTLATCSWPAADDAESYMMAMGVADEIDADGAVPDVPGLADEPSRVSPALSPARAR